MDQQDTLMFDESDEGSQESSTNGSASQSKLLNEQSMMDCSSSDNKNQARFKVKKWTAVAMWAYDISVDNCAICRNHIMDKCIDCQTAQEESNVDGNCSIAWGRCSHVFHMHCISTWINTRHVCPLDNKDWEFKKIENNN